MRGSGQGKGSGPAGSIVRHAPRGLAKRVRTRGSRWSEEAERVFLDALAASCNLQMSAEKVGFTTRGIYARRRRCAAFAQRFNTARAQGFARLEMELVRAACDSMEGIEFDADRPIPKMTVDQAILLLKMHKPQVMGERSRHPGGLPERMRTLAELAPSIKRKIEAIRNAPEPDED
jgi:hypothetical protein